MVLEYLISPGEAERKPWELFVLAFLFVSFGVLTQLLIPSLQGSVIIFALIPLIPIFFFLLIDDEAGEERFDAIKEQIAHYKKTVKQLEASEKPSLPFAFMHRFERVLAVHRPLIELFAFLFLGAVFAYAFWFAVLPQQIAFNLFYPQLQEVRTISSIVTAKFFSQDVFTFLFLHNLQVLGLMLLFSLVYGIGALYLLLWNASIIGVVIAEKIAAQGIAGGAIGFIGLLPHGIFEISSYFVGALAGAILSIAIMRSSYKKPFFKHLVEDVLLLFGLALVLLAVGALIEAAY